MLPITIRQYRPGDGSRVCALHMKLYERDYHFKPIFEYYVMSAMAEFLKDPEGSMLWVAECEGKIVGSIAIVKQNDLAQLRWFIMDNEYQGQGTGTKLMETALDFCREQGYKKVYLWTVDMLAPARHLYEKYGFYITDSVPNFEWAEDELLEERWELDL